MLAPSRRTLRLAAAVVPLAVLAGMAWRQLPFLADDALISLRYAARLLEGQGLTWNDGDRVEGYSNLLWILASAGLGALGLDLIDAVRALGLAAMGGTVLVIARFARTAAGALAAGLAFALAPPVAVWTVGGLEQPLVALLLSLGVLGARSVVEGSDRTLAASLPLALLCLTRPDAPLLVAALALSVALLRGPRHALLLGAPAALAVAAQTAFRVTYHGDWLANPSRAKVGFSLPRVEVGIGYVGEGLTHLAGLFVLGGVALRWVREREVRRDLLLVGLPLLAWLAYVAVIGGDIFPARRQLVPAIVLGALLAAAAVDRLASWSRIATALVPAVCLGALLAAGPRDPTYAWAAQERWEWDGKQVGILLRTAFGDRRPLLAVDSAGTLPYFSGLPALDLLGLNDRYLALHPPPGFGTGYMGHELGDGRYVLSREPDLLIFCTPSGCERGRFRSGVELVRMRAFRQQYVLRHLETSPPVVRSAFWARREGGPIGIRREDREVEVPGFLLASSRATPFTLDAEGRPGVRLGTTPAELDGLRFSAGPARITAEVEGEVTLEVFAGATALAAGPSPLELDAPGGPLRLRASGRGHLRGLSIQRGGSGATGTAPQPAATGTGR